MGNGQIFLPILYQMHFTHVRLLDRYLKKDWKVFPPRLFASCIESSGMLPPVIEVLKIGLAIFVPGICISLWSKLGENNSYSFRHHGTAIWRLNRDTGHLEKGCRTNFFLHSRECNFFKQYVKETPRRKINGNVVFIKWNTHHSFQQQPSETRF
jgi:hypothetical protein